MTDAELEVSQLRRINETVLRCASVALAIVNRTYRILTINAMARRMFSIRDIAYDQDFLHTVRGLPYHAVRSAIDSAFREHSTMTLSEIELDSVEGFGRYIDLTIIVMHSEPSAPELAVISAVDVSESVHIKSDWKRSSANTQIWLPN